MADDDFFTPTDADVLRMENELLAFEVGYLKTRLAEQQPVVDRVERLESEVRRVREVEASLGGEMSRLRMVERRYLEVEPYARSLRDEVERLKVAEKDLQWVLRRIGSGPLRPVMRLRGGFRALEERYLGDGSNGDEAAPRRGDQTAALRGDDQTAPLRGDETAPLRGDEQTAPLRGDTAPDDARV